MNKRVIVFLLMITMIISSFSLVNAIGEDTELPTLAQLIAKDYSDGMGFKELIDKYNLYEDDYIWFAYTFLGTPTPEKTVHQAIAYDYTSGDDLKDIMARYGLGTVDFDIGSLEPSKTIEEAIEYDWQNDENREVLKERYGLDEDYIRWYLERSIREPVLDSKKIVVREWLSGSSYQVLKDKYGFTDTWFLDGIKDLLVKR